MNELQQFLFLLLQFNFRQFRQLRFNICPSSNWLIVIFVKFPVHFGFIHIFDWLTSDLFRLSNAITSFPKIFEHSILESKLFRDRFCCCCWYCFVKHLSRHFNQSIKPSSRTRQHFRDLPWELQQSWRVRFAKRFLRTNLQSLSLPKCPTELI